ncbi:MAG: ABC transporter ATP-binding protein [Pelagibacterales bacterium]|nr:ABC transporter ATP-binding protein [Pelagibacterales bacterium]PPR16235.1 MAG: Lipopolysaccharide export system ATP-binding protein LptB [Alphaproteobacteria bacterium MarineAlpha9_Bin3]|tara:strand:- start:133 stop:867 length:735 start_codon:yes stop_codon:yes gene_type:complete
MILKLSNINKSFGSTIVLEDINITSEKKECLAIIGPNGAGKSTLFKVISGIIKQDNGYVEFNSKSVNALNVEERARLGISQSFQKNSLFLEMTVKESLMIACSHKYKVSFNFIKPLYKNNFISEDAIKIAKDIGLQNYLDIKSEFLSYGLQRQLELGIAIACNPRLLLLDEPTAGMSPAETKDIINLIKKLSKEYSIIIVEHDMEVIYNLADKIYVLDRGKLIFEGSPNAVKNSELVQKVYLGI